MAVNGHLSTHLLWFVRMFMVFVLFFSISHCLDFWSLIFCKINERNMKRDVIATSNHWDFFCLPSLKTRMIMHVNIEEHLLYRMWRVLKEKSLVHVVPEPVRVFIACSESCFYRWFKVGYSNEWWAVRPMGQEGKIPFLSHMYSSQKCNHLFTQIVWKRDRRDLFGQVFQLWSLWPKKSDTKVRCWPALVPHTYLARCRFGLHGYSVAPCLGDIKNRLGGFEESGCSWDVQVLLNQSVLPLTMLLPWAQDVELAKPQICRSSGLTLKHWLRRFPWRRGITASASRISLVSLVLIVLISIDSEIRFIFLVFQVLGAWPPVSLCSILLVPH